MVCSQALKNMSNLISQEIEKVIHPQLEKKTHRTGTVLNVTVCCLLARFMAPD